MREVWRRLSLGGRLCLAVIAAYFALAVFGEAQYRVARARDVTPSYNVVHEDARYQPPSWTHPMGTDNLGRDVALRLVQGSRIAFHVGIMTSLIAIPLGVLLGLLGGYFGGKMDSFVVWLCATVASMPGLLFILAISMVVGQGLLGIYLGIDFKRKLIAQKAKMLETQEANARELGAVLDNSKRLQAQIAEQQQQTTSLQTYYEAKSRKHLRAIRALIWLCIALAVTLLALVFIR